MSRCSAEHCAGLWPDATNCGDLMRWTAMESKCARVSLLSSIGFAWHVRLFLQVFHHLPFFMISSEHSEFSAVFIEKHWFKNPTETLLALLTQTFWGGSFFLCRNENKIDTKKKEDFLSAKKSHCVQLCSHGDTLLLLTMMTMTMVIWCHLY